MPIHSRRIIRGSLGVTASVGLALAYTVAGPSGAAHAAVETDCTKVTNGQNCATVTNATVTTPVIGGVQYIVAKFTSTGTFVPNQTMDVEYLVVGGGGGSGAIGNNGGGGGGGGGQVVSNVGGSPVSTTGSTSVTVTVGGGGAGGTNTPTIGAAGSAGSSSSAAFTSGTITAVGGGGGGGSTTTTPTNPASGGNGGGGGGGSATNGNPAGGTGTYNGGAGRSNTTVIANRGGGGGAGASANGGSATAAGTTPVVSGSGGDGAANSITGSSVTYGGGGAGGVSNQAVGNSLGSAGSGGGGAGSKGGLGTAGTANTGGGAGGPGGNNTGTQVGSAGGSGVVVVRYKAFNAPAAPGAPTLVQGNGELKASWTAPTNTGGTDVTGYTITSVSPDGSKSCTATAPATTCTISGLTNGVGYTFSAKATNAVGTSGAGSASSSVKPKLSAPNPTGVANTAGVLSWNAVDTSTYNSTTGYLIQYKPRTGSVWKTYAAKGPAFQGADMWPANTAPTSLQLNATVGNCGVSNTSAGWTFCPLPYGVPAAGQYDFRVASISSGGAVSVPTSTVVGP